MKKKLLILLVLFSVFIARVNAKESMDDLFKKYAPNGVFEAHAVKPENNKISLAFIDFYNDYYNEHAKSNLSYRVNVVLDIMQCNDDFSECELFIGSYEGDDYEEDSRTVKVKWAEADKDVKAKVDTYVKKVDEVEDFLIEDLNRVKNIRINHHTDDLYLANALLFSDEFNELGFDRDIDVRTYFRSGANGEPLMYNQGSLVFVYDGILYGGFFAYHSYSGISLSSNNVLYIPDETENTPEAFVAAAQKRLDEYFGKNVVKVEKAQKHENTTLYGGSAKTSGYYYKFYVDDDPEAHLFYVVKDSSKMQNPLVKAKDDSGVTLETESADVYPGSKFTVNKLDKDSKEFKDILKKLGIKEGIAYDFKLYSLDDELISKLSNGKFVVSIPISDDLVGKDLIVYYIDGDKIEEYDVTIKDGMAQFITDHFSTYVLAEKSESNKKESFEIIPFIAGFVVGLGLVVLVVTLLKRKK